MAAYLVVIQYKRALCRDAGFFAQHFEVGLAGSVADIEANGAAPGIEDQDHVENSLQEGLLSGAIVAQN